MNSPPQCIAFDGGRRVAVGSLADVVGKVKEIFDRGDRPHVQIFDYSSSEPVDVDLSGTRAEVLQRVEARSRLLENAAVAQSSPVTRRAGPGRPKLGVVAREVTLLPRHWEWLAEQRGGASATLRRLVDEARRASSGKDRVRRAREATYRFMMAVAGDYPHFEDATRALFANDESRFAAHVQGWPPDVRAHVLELADRAFDSASAAH